ncbi:hypothetical protein ACRAWF_07270 [Streptomyces sp. L7]
MLKLAGALMERLADVPECLRTGVRAVSLNLLVEGEAQVIGKWRQRRRDRWIIERWQRETGHEDWGDDHVGRALESLDRSRTESLHVRRLAIVPPGVELSVSELTEAWGKVGHEYGVTHSTLGLSEDRPSRGPHEHQAGRRRPAVADRPAGAARALEVALVGGGRGRLARAAREQRLRPAQTR